MSCLKKNKKKNDSGIIKHAPKYRKLFFCLKMLIRKICGSKIKTKTKKKKKTTTTIRKQIEK